MVLYECATSFVLANVRLQFPNNLILFRKARDDPQIESLQRRYARFGNGSLLSGS